MRLTLRTLLAYLDDTLDPASAGELGEKVRGSEFASGLVHRIRSVTGRLRLSAPPIEGRGLGADANTVAEYLDSTLPVDRLPEFEKVCLESDMHLSEVASCHQVLALVLGEPAHVDLDLRNRIHNLPVTPTPEALSENSYRLAEPEPEAHSQLHRVDQPAQPQGGSAASAHQVANHGAVVAAVPAGQAAAQAAGPASHQTPDYLAVERRSAFPGWLAALVAGFLITAAVILMARNMLGDPNSAADLAATDTTHDASPRGATGADLAPANAEPTTPANAMMEESITGNSSERAGGFDSLANNLPTAPPLVATEPEEESPSDLRVVEDGGDFVVAPEGAAVSEPMGDPNANLVAENATNDAESEAGLDLPTTPPANVPSPPSEHTLPPADAPPTEVGRLASEDQVLAFFNQDVGHWQRLPPRALLVSGLRLRVPTLFRPSVSLSSGIQMTLNDRTELRLQRKDQNSVQLALDFGQAIISTLGDARVIHLLLNDRPVEVTLGDAQSQFAIENRLVRLPGDDPFREGVRSAVARIWPTSGHVAVKVGDSDPQTVLAGSVWQWNGQQATVGAAAASPDWIEMPKRRQIDRLALDRLTQQLGTERALTLELFEVVEKNDRRNEVRSLAARALASLEQYNPLIDLFSDPKQHFAWTAHFEELQAGLARGPQSAQHIMDAANRHWGADSDQLLRMIYGYSPDELRRSGATELVSTLSQEQLEARVIAIETLRSITGKTKRFFAEKTAAKRREAVRRWTDELAAGSIRYAVWPPQQ